MSKREQLIRVEIGYGRSKWMTLDQYLNIDYQEELAKDDSEEIDDPFYHSTISGRGAKASGEDTDYLSFELPYNPLPDPGE